MRTDLKVLDADVMVSAGPEQGSLVLSAAKRLIKRRTHRSLASQFELLRGWEQRLGPGHFEEAVVRQQVAGQS